MKNLYTTGRQSIFNFKNSRLRCLVIAAMVVGNLFFASSALGQVVGDYRTQGTGGNWNALTSWQRLNSIGPEVWVQPTSGQGYPGELAVPGTVTILNTDDVTLNVTPANNIGALVFQAGTDNNSLTFSGSNILTVTGAVTMNGTTVTSGTLPTLMNVNAGTLNCGSIAINPVSGNFGSTSRRTTVVITTGAVTVTGNLSCSGDIVTAGGQSGILFSDAGTLNIGGNLWPSSNIGFFNHNDEASVSFTSAGTQTVDNGSQTFFNVTHNGTGTLQLSNNTLTAENSFNNSGGGIVNLNNESLTVGDLQGSGTITSGIAGSITITSGSNNANTTFAGVIQNGTGTVALTKTGTGTLTLTGTNTYTGATSLNGGVLLLNSAGALPGGIGSSGGTSNLIINGGVLGLGTGNFSRGLGTGVTQVQWNGNGGFAAYNADRTVNIGGAGATMTWVGGDFIESGEILILSASDATHTVDFQNPIALNTNARTVQVDNGTASIDAELSGLLSGTTTSGITKTGTGTLILSNTNTYNGTTTVSAGVIDLQSSAGLGNTTGTTTVASGAAIQIDGNGLSIAEAINTLIGTGISSGGALRNLANNNTWSGAITLGAAGARINSDAGTLTITGGVTGNTLPLTIGGSGNTTFSTTAIATTSGTVTKDGAGTLTLSGANTYTGLTTISAGVLNIQNATGTGTTGGGVTVTAGAALQLQGGIIVGTEPLTLNGNGISSDGALRNISGNNTWGGVITLASNSTIQSDSDLLTLSNANSINDASNQSVILQGAGNGLVSGTITTGTGTVTKQGVGTWTLSGGNTYSGGTTISGGVLSISADGNLGNASGGLTFNNGATLRTTTTSVASARAITLNSGGATFDLGVPFNHTGTISGGNGIVTGGNDLILNRASGNNAIGAISLNSGRVFIFTGNSADASSISVANGATLDFGIVAAYSLTTNSITASFVSGAGLANRGGTLTVPTANATFPSSGTIIFNSDDQATTAINVTGNYPALTGNLTFQVGGGNATVGLVTLSGVISETGGVWGINKTSTGTLLLTGASNYTGVTTVTGGRLELGVAAERISNSSSLTLAGGTFSTGATTGFGETLNTLELTENSTINLGTTNHTLTFANSSGVAWTPLKILTITGWTGSPGATGAAGKIVVGPGGLSAAQLSKIQFTGFALGAQIVSGEVVPVGTFYSQSSSTPESPGNWNSARDGSGTAAVAGNFTGGYTFVIQGTGNGGSTPHTMTTAAPWSVSGTGSKVQIENGASLISTSAITLATATTFQIDGGGTYVHNNATASPSTGIFGGTESFAANSNVRIDNWASAATVITTGVTLPFGNLELNWTGNAGGNWQQSWTGAINLCAGNFRVTSVGSGGATIRLTATGTPTITIGGSYIQTAGTVDFSNNTGSSILNVAGNFTHTGGTITETGTGASNAINMNGTTAQTIESTGFANTIAYNVSPTGAGTVEVPVTKTFTAATGTAFTVSNSSSATELTVNGTLETAVAVTNTGATTVNGTFRLNAGGSVATNSFTYGSSSILVYNQTGSVAVGTEWTGNSTTAGLGIPQNVTILNSTTVNMPATNRGLAGNMNIAAGTLALNALSDLFVGGDWTKSGTFTPNGRTVTFNGGNPGNIGTSNFANITFSGAGTKTATGILSITGNVDISNNFTAGLFTHTVGGNWTRTGTFTATGSTIDFSGGGAGNIGASNFNNSTFSGAGVKTATGALSIGGNVSITNNFSAGALVHTVGGNWSNSGAFTPSTSTIDFNHASATQTLNNGASQFFTLTHSGAGTLQLITNNIIVNGDLNNSAGTLDANSLNITLKRHWTNSATFIPGTGTLFMQGASNQNMSGSTFYNLTIDNAAGVTLLTDETVSNTLALTNGNVTTGSNFMIVSNNNPLAISGGSSTSYINGNLRRAIAAGANTYPYPIGTGTAYANVSMAFLAGTIAGNLDGFTTNLDHGSIGTSTLDPLTSVNRFWSFTINGGGLTTANYNATFNWANAVPIDEDATFQALDPSPSIKVGKYTGSTWSYPTVSGSTESSISISAESGFSDFIVAKGCSNFTPVITISETSGTTDDDGILCAGDEATLDAGVYASYSWSTTETTQTIDVSSAATYTVTVTDANGCTGTDDVMITVNPNPTPTITVDETSGTIDDDGILCAGDEATLDAGVYTSYLWSTTETTQTIDVSIADTYSVTVTNANGCMGTDNMIITVNPNPTPAITISETSGTTNDDGILCAGDEATLDAGVYSSYLWSTAETTQTIDVDATDTYSVTVTNANGCIGSDNVMITVNPNPTPAITISETSGTTDDDGILCAGDEATLDAGVYTSYLWSTTETTQTIDVSIADTYSVTVTNANGCMGTDNMIITVNPNPTPAITISETSGTTNDDGILCAGDEATLDAGVYSSYLWSTTETSPTIDVSIADTYSVTVTDANGCIGTDNVLITVNPTPTPAITISETSGTTDDDGILCSGDEATLDAGAYSSYLWSTTETAQTIDVSVTDTYSVTVTDANGCIGADNVVITVNPNPTPMITVTETSGTTDDDGILCSGDEATLDAGSYDSYEWSTAQTSQTIVVDAAGTYSVTVTDANGCIGTDNVMITVNPTPIGAPPAVVEVCFGESVEIDGNASGGSEPYTHSWTFGSEEGGTGASQSNIENENQETATFNTSGLTNSGYAIIIYTVTDANGCSSSTMVTVFINANPVCDILGGETVCPNSENEHVASPNGMVSYSWVLSDANGATFVDDIDDEQTISVIAGPGCNTSYTLELTVSDENGCVSTCSEVVSVHFGSLNAPDSEETTISCPQDADQPTAPDILDACGRTVEAGLIGSTPAPECNGDVVWTFKYTACDGTTTDDWTYTYHVDYSGGLLNTPANTESTVSCPAASQVNPGAPAAILDACGRTVNPEFEGADAAPECNGDVVWTWSYTACDEETTTTYTHTYHVDYSGGLLNTPANTESTVSCPAASQVNPGAPAAILDACGRTVNPEFEGADAAPECNGDVVWTWSYTACDEETTTTYTHTYHVDYSGGLLNTPANTESTVSCPAASQVNPGAPAAILDACGRTVNPEFEGADAAPECNGDVVWTWSYTACDEETTTTYTHTYHVDYSGGLLNTPANTESTVSCPAASQVNPGAPAAILDACGRTVNPEFEGADGAPECNGDVVWTWSYTACDEETTTTYTHTYHVDYSGGLLNTPANTESTVSCPAASQVNPGAPAAILDACGRTVNPEFEGADAAPECNGDVVWTWSYTACDEETTTTYTHTYHVDYSGGLLNTPANTESTVSCPAASQVNPGAPAAILDACGRTVNPEFEGADAAPECNGDVVWTWSYTACDEETTTTYTHTYHVDYSGGLLNTPANTESTVSCPAASQVNPGAPAAILDACGRTVNPEFEGADAAPECNGDVVWTWSYTACDEETTTTYTHTYHVDYSGGLLNTPANTESTVSCPAASQVNPGAPAAILDACGRTVNPEFEGADAAPECNGDVVWTWSYTACDEETTTTYTHTYHVDYSGGLLNTPANTESTVSCPAASQVNPGAPAAILDACGRTVNPEFEGADAAPECNGDVVWTWSYTACDEETTTTYTHTYHVDYSGGLLNTPANTESTVSCPAASQVNPGAPAAILDACGRTVNPEFEGADAAPECNGDVVWTWSYTACDEETTTTYTHTYHVDYSGGLLNTPANTESTVSCPAASQVNPGAPAAILDACGRTVNPEFEGADAAPECNGDVVWTWSYTACDEETTTTYTHTYHVDYSGGLLNTPANTESTVSCPAASQVNPGAPAAILDACGRTVNPEFEGADAAPECNGDVVWTWSYTACDEETTTTYTHTYHVDYSGGLLNTPANTESTVSCPAASQVNPGAPAAILDACGRTVNPEFEGADAAPECNGDVVWTWSYTACDEETTTTYTHTYHVDYSGGLLNTPANTESTVSCPAASQVNPGAPAAILDACGRTVNPEFEGADAAPECNGDVVWTWSYTACDEETTTTYTHTYHVDYSGGLLNTPANTESTVSCPAASQVNPGAPAAILDACGRTVNPEFEGADAAPECNGDVVWTWSYTACDEETTTTYTHTYHVDYSGGLLNTPANTESTVSCPAASQVNPGAPAAILDACGRTVNPEFEGADAAPECNGDVVWTWSYTACDEETTTTYTHTYHVDYSGGLLNTPANTESTVSCPAASQVNPGAPAAILDACGRTVNPEFEGADAAPECNGDVVWTWSYTACDEETTTTYTHTYHVDYSGGLLNTPANTESTVSCPAASQVNPGAPAAILDACGRTVNPEFEGADAAPECNGDVVWTWSYTACDEETTTTYTHTYHVDYSGGLLNTPANTESTVSCPAASQVNPGAPAAILDACGRTVNPEFEGADAAPECNGDVVWTWSYTACDEETTTTYTHTYHVDYSGGLLNTPANTESTVSCPAASQVNPGAPAAILDACGRTVNPEFEGADAAPECNGDVVWTWSYTACDEETTTTYTHTYHVDYSGGLLNTPANTESTVSCPAASQVNPGAPAAILDACGRTVNPEFEGADAAPECNGDVVWTWSYTACDEETTTTYTHTYHVDYSGGLLNTLANTESTVSCPAASQVNPGAPAAILDACGRTVNPEFEGADAAPECNGDVVWTWSYTACDEETTTTYTHTYHVDYSGGLLNTPANTESTVSCPAASQVNPGAPAAILDACGRTVNPEFEGADAAPECNGDVVWTWSYTACDEETTTTYTHTYHVDYSGGLLNTPANTESTVSCPAASQVNPGAPAAILDACGRTVNPEFEGADAAPECNGDVVWTWSYTACDEETTSTYTHTYHVDYSGGLLNTPANTESTVSCPAASQVNPGAPAAILDACGRTVNPEFEGADAAPECNGDVVWTWSYTACDEETTTTYTHTYHVDYSGGLLNTPANTESTVSCPAASQVNPGAPAAILDACGRTVNPEFEGADAAPECNGDVVWTWSYTACDEETTTTYTHTYHVDYSGGLLNTPANTESTVSCPAASQVNPGAPAAILDACGRTVNPEFEGADAAPECNGDVVWTWSYTACDEETTTTYTHTYHVDYSGGLLNTPANTESTVSCPAASQVNPGAPAAILDACGRTVNPEFEGADAAPECNGDVVWTWSYTACDEETTTTYTHTYHVDYSGGLLNTPANTESTVSCPAASQVNPGAPAAILDACGRTVNPEFEGADAAPECNGDVVWTWSYTACDEETTTTYTHTYHVDYSGGLLNTPANTESTVSCPAASQVNPGAPAAILDACGRTVNPEFEGADAAPECNGDVVWTWSYTACDEETTTTYTHTYHVDYSGGLLNTPANTESTVSCPAASQVNPGAPAAILDACGRTVNPEFEGADAAPECNGDVVWTWSYTACDEETTTTYTHTYHVDYSGGLLNTPANTESTVSCPAASQVNPGAPAAILDACGRTVNPEFEGADAAPECNGDVVWTWSYTACDEETTTTYTHTYHVDYSGGLLNTPANTESTVSCPAASQVNPGAPAAILDACGRTVNPEFEGADAAPECNGDVVWTWSYTACDEETTTTYTHTYHVDYSGGLLNTPANTESTVSCPAASQVNPGAPAAILDACGRTVNPEFEGADAAPECNGDVVWTWSYTACDEETTTTYTHTYHVDYSGGLLNTPANTESTVSCPAASQVNPGAPAAILDACGRTVNPEFEGADAAPECNGDVVWTWSYTACDEETTTTYTHTYHVDYSGGLLNTPANTESTVSCPAASQVNPGAPAAILDACGRTVNPEFEGADAAPECNGDVVWTWSYTACDEETTTTYTHTYHVDYSGGLLNTPANTESTVSCPAASQVNPGAPAAILDACGRTVNPEFEGADAAPECNGDVVWTWSYTACDEETTTTYTHTYHVDYSGGLLNTPANTESTVSCPAASQVNPGAPAAILDACGRTVNPEFEGADAAPECNGDVVWTWSYTACDEETTTTYTHTYHVDYSGGLLNTPANTESTVSCPAASQVNPGAPAAILDACGRTVNPEFEGADAAPECNGDVVWTWSYTACDEETTTTYTHTYHVDYSGGLLNTPANTESTVSCPAASQVNPGAPAAILDACGRTVNPEFEGADAAPECNGDVVWTWSYTACDEETTTTYTHTYHVDYSGGLLNTPANTESTVSCPAASQVNPGAPAAILDACGRTVNPEFEGADAAPECNGDVVWTWSYTACDEETTSTYTHTYHVDYSGGLLNTPANTESTVSCPAASQVNPGAPAAILDACGRTVNPEFEGADAAPECNGDVVWTWSYTACDEETTTTYTHTYHVDYSGGLLNTPANTESTVSCPAASQVNPGAPAAILDACGRTVNPEFEGADAAPECNGDVVWTWSYTACDEETTTTYTHTYHVDYSGGLLNTPANTESTVSCPAASQVNPGAPAAILDACGRTVSAGLIGSTPAPECNGDVVWTYRYTACDGTTTDDWTYTYHVIYSDGLEAPDNEETTVSCPGDASVPGAPEDILDACGRTVSAGLIGSTPAPECNGDVVWTYRYTACDGTTTDDWTFTYHVIYSDGLDVPANGGLLLSCGDDAGNPGQPEDILDACGRTVSAGLIGSTPVPECDGNVVWTYRYTACDGTTTADWIYTYTVDDNTPPTITPGTLDDCYATVAEAESAALDATTATDNCSEDLTYSVTTEESATCDSLITVTVTDPCGNSDFVTYSVMINCQVVRLKVFLEGPYDIVGDSMFTTINTSHRLPGQLNNPFVYGPNTPHGQPYNTLPYNYNANTGLIYGDAGGDIPYPFDVVDWILVTVREDGIMPEDNIWTCAGWVHSDGTVTFPEDCGDPDIDISLDYHILVQHRNHLGILSPGYPVSGVDIGCEGRTLEWDFTQSDSYKPTFRAGQKLIDGVWMMLAGNGEQVNTSRAISSPDRTLWNQQQGLLGYRKADHNMNISVGSEDETLWKLNQNKSTGVIFY